MNKGGLRENSDGNYNHLFKRKWNLGKTTTIRIPEVIKKQILELAKYLDKNQKEEIESINLVDKFKKNNQEKKSKKYRIGMECLEEYFTEQGNSLAELQKSKAGTKKRQLAEIHEWLSKKAR